jgi:O-methyltransferase involved in polyketide biosynthesis
VVEIGTGLNTRFDRVDNGRVRWIDLDLPDTIELRRRFFTDTARRHMMAGSALDEDWLDAVAAQPGPYFFAVEGVLAYLPEADVHRVLSRIAQRFGGALVALDSYPRRTLDQQHKMAARKNIPARWAWSCDDPRELERLGLRVVESTRVTRPPAGLRATLPRRYRLALPLADPVFGPAVALTLFRVPEPAPAG